ncbi:DUF3243 domain-containing protein [Cohnella fermenti]|uniref:DUF3243 domain-containing protein n=1 Tax=Cohnella fermenti TaxID=2565925 RepID=A0A4S4BZ04_9BACL|nr:DUF3243 domain-containing protein [Cohnella fermenti]THF78437.1 DUF3243 domain-containing protein [Cohnella fermenti]
MSNVLRNFDSWKHFLGDRVDAAKNAGISEEAISRLAYEIGEFLDNKVEPQNDEQRVLKELWDAGNESERKTIAGLMVKLADRS